MDRVIDYQELKDDYILVDVRSSGEYDQFHIPGAKNIPLFSDEERKIVGTVYKQESVKKAKEIGVQFVANKLPQIYTEIRELCENYNNVVIYCARGGMRSRSICSLINSLGYRVLQLNGGYKSYRGYVIEQIQKINQQINYIVLHGYTGVGKTLILNELEQNGFDILDLEGAANHRGSCLGKVGLSEIVTQKQFESIIFDKLKNRKSDNVFIESESSKIGNVFLPAIIKENMKKGKQILIEANIETRAKRIVEEYTKSNNADRQIIEAIQQLKNIISNKSIEELILMVQKKDYIEASKFLMTEYYDILYNNTQKNYNYDYIINSDDLNLACVQIATTLGVSASQ